jgi:2-polyprenyl-6-hydroxyphenyl methylase/3-demethylubiquinone-9 3-methyltransferase
MFGPYERRVAEAYRSLYLDIDAFVDLLRQWNPRAARILEIGCGEGAVTERLRAAYPDAVITAIDINPRIGRMYGGSREAVRFLQCTAQEIAAAQPGSFDLVVLCDVLHHVPVEFRQELLGAIRIALAPHGALAFKDWERNFSPVHWLSYASDRWLTGDRISYMSRAQMLESLSSSFGAAAPAAEARIRPRWNNIAFLLRPLRGP